MRGRATYRLVVMALFLTVMMVLAAGSVRAQIADTSDAFFSIVIPEAAARDVNMGTVLLGSMRDTLVRPFFRNIGVVPIRIDSLYFEGGAAGDFALIAGRPPLRLATAAEAAAGFSFAPTAVGTRQAVVVVITQDDTLRYTIRGEGVRPSVEVVAGMVDFGAHPVGSQRDSTVEVMLRNLSAGPLRLSSVTQTGPDTAQFALLDGAQAITLAPFATHAMRLRFAPRRAGRTSGSVTFAVDGVTDRPVALLFGEGIGVQADVLLATDTLSARTGEIVVVPIRLLEERQLLLSGARALRTELRFDASLLVPVGATPKGSVRDGKRVIALENLPTLPGPGGVIAEYQFVATLGDSERTVLELVNSAAIGAEVTVREQPGAFTLLDLCEEGGRRLFDGSGRLALHPNHPNPFNGETRLPFELPTAGPVRIALLDLAGREALLCFDGQLAAGAHSVLLDVHTLSSGFYIVRLESAGRSVQRVLHVLR